MASAGNGSQEPVRWPIGPESQRGYRPSLGSQMLRSRWGLGLSQTKAISGTHPHDRPTVDDVNSRTARKCP